MRPNPDDELMLLWRQGTSAEPIAEEIARLAGRASMTRFDRTVFRRNFAEYAAGLAIFAFAGWQIATGKDRIGGTISIVCVSFVLGYLWWQHRDLVPLDPAADARVYHSAMLARIDKQIHLLGSVRYWYLMPLSCPIVWTFLKGLHKKPFGSILLLALCTVLYMGIAWLNEHLGVQKLRAERAKIEALYED